MKHQLYYPSKITQKLYHKDATVFVCPECDALNIVLIQNLPSGEKRNWHPFSQINGYPSVAVSSEYQRKHHFDADCCWEELWCRHCHTHFLEGSIPGVARKKGIEDGKAFSYFFCPECGAKYKFPASKVNYGSHKYCDYCRTPFILEE